MKQENLDTNNVENNKKEVLLSDPVSLLEYIVSNLVENADKVSVNPIYGPSSLVLELKVDNSDIGKVIGQSGRIIKALRSLLQSVHSKQMYNDEGTLERFRSISLELVEEH